MLVNNRLLGLGREGVGGNTLLVIRGRYGCLWSTANVSL